MRHLKTLWGIRHIRWAFLSLGFWIWWDDVGRHIGAFPNPADLEYLDKVWSGDA